MGFGLIIQRRSQVLGEGGRNAPEWVAGINRNARPEWIGIGGRNQSESVAGMRRNTQGISPSLRGGTNLSKISFSCVPEPPISPKLLHECSGY
jgi:hypothetical protein